MSLSMSFVNQTMNNIFSHFLNSAFETALCTLSHQDSRNQKQDPRVGGVTFSQAHVINCEPAQVIISLFWLIYLNLA